MHVLTVRSHQREELVEFTDQVQQKLKESGAREGVVVLYVQHTTAGLTVNENADPDVPRDMLVVCLGKSTYARCGIIVNVTPLEPEWRGRVTIEISNTTPLPAKIYAGEGIAQMLFFRGEGVCRTSYADKKGKYQDQKGLTLPFVAGATDAQDAPAPPKRKRK